MKYLGVFLMLLASCASMGPPPACNPVMVQCNPADYPPLAEMLPKSPVPPPMTPGVLP